MKKRATQLYPGQAVALVAPAFSFDPALLDQGRTQLQSRYGLTCLNLDSLHEQSAYFAGNDARRLEELFHWLTCPDIGGLIAVRGGYGCARIYPELIRKLKARGRRGLPPKVVVGYSDLTIVLNGLLQDLGWITFHGPVVVGRSMREPLPVEEQTFRRCLFSTEPLGEITDPQMEVIEPGQAKGPLVGGCLSLVASSIGTSYELDTRGKILFLEDVDEKPYRLDRMLTHLLHAGLFDKCAGVVFGQMAHCEPGPDSRDPRKTTANEAIRLAIGPHLARKSIPAVFNFPAGHGSPQITFPLGTRVHLKADPRRPTVIFLEAAVKARR